MKCSMSSPGRQTISNKNKPRICGFCLFPLEAHTESIPNFQDDCDLLQDIHPLRNFSFQDIVASARRGCKCCSAMAEVIRESIMASEISEHGEFMWNKDEKALWWIRPRGPTKCSGKHFQLFTGPDGGGGGPRNPSLRPN
jgi:hypothetical protein